jgi:hypothetical protein
VVGVTREQHMNPIGLGFSGSIIGVFAGVMSTYNFFKPGPATITEVLIEMLLWAAWLVLQGVGFLAIYRRYNDNLSLATFVFGLISAVVELAILFTFLAAPGITDYAELLATYAGLLFMLLIIFFAEALYLILGGVTILRLGQRRNQAMLFTLAGVVFIVAGAFIGLMPFAPLLEPSFSIVIVVNILACLVFYHLTGEEVGKGTVTASGSGAGIQ